MRHPWRLTVSVAVLTAGSAVAFRAPVVWVVEQSSAGYVSSLHTQAVFLSSVLLAAAVGWVLADVADQHVLRWLESCFLGTFVGWMIGYGVTERVLFVPALYPESSLLVIIEIAFQNYFFTGPLLAFAVLAGIGFARVQRDPPHAMAEHDLPPMTAVALLGFSLLTAGSLGGLTLMNPQFPWNPDQLGLVQTVMTAIIPMIALLLIFAAAWKLSHLPHDIDSSNSWLILVVLGALAGVIGVRVGWALGVEPVTWSVGEVLFAIFLGIPAAVVIISGFICGYHGLSSAEMKRVREILGDYSTQQPS